MPISQIVSASIADGAVTIPELAATGTPDSTTFFRGDSTWSTPIASALSTATGSAPSYSARAWVNFNGTGVVAIRNGANVTSITDNGTGDYTVNFTVAMVDANYSLQCTARFGGSSTQNQPFFKGDTAWQTAASARFNFNFHITNAGNTALDAELVNVVVVR
jgi:hypothetical protein